MPGCGDLLEPYVPFSPEVAALQIVESFQAV
jgi:hypothetical protein